MAQHHPTARDDEGTGRLVAQARGLGGTPGGGERVHGEQHGLEVALLVAAQVRQLSEDGSHIAVPVRDEDADARGGGVGRLLGERRRGEGVGGGASPATSASWSRAARVPTTVASRGAPR